MFTLIGTNIIFNEIEYFIYLNVWLLLLLFFIIIYFLIINSSIYYFSSIYFNNSTIELISTLLCFIFLLIIVSPSLIILLDYDISILPTYNIYTLGYQWSWSFNITTNINNINTYCEHYIISSSNYSIIKPNTNNLNINNWLNDITYYKYNCLKVHIKSIDGEDITYYTYNIFEFLILNYYVPFLKYMSASFNNCYYKLLYYKYNPNIWNNHYNPNLWNNNINHNNINNNNDYINNIINKNNGNTSDYNIKNSYYNSKYNRYNINDSYYSYNTAFYLFDVSSYVIYPLFSGIKIYLFSFDVIHSYGFYSFGIKIDTIPGQINVNNTLRCFIKGEHRGFRFELCGQQHSSMLLLGLVLLY